MKKDKVIYWTATAIIAVVTIFSLYTFTFNDNPEEGFARLGLPDYFRIELSVAKFLGLLVLLAPIKPGRLKEFAYFGFGITLLSACIAHYAIGDPLWRIIDPFFFFCVLVVSYLYYHKTAKGAIDK